MESPTKTQVPNIFMPATSSHWSRFLRTVGFASLLAVCFGLVRLLLHLWGWGSFTAWEGPDSILFYLPAGAILLAADHIDRKYRVPNWWLGGMIGFAFYVSFHWLTDVATELGLGGILQILLYALFEVGEFLWGPIDDYLMASFGSIRAWIEALGINWLTALPFVALGMVYASVYKNRWVLLLTVLLSLVFICFWLVQVAKEILWGLMG